MPITKDLLLAILSMDAYNREYGAGIEIGSVDVGTTSFNDHEETGVTPVEYAAWQAAGFYAVSYDTPDGTVISYRGTDDPLGDKSGSDIWRGWVGATGAPTGQANLAFEFFEAVTGADAFDGVDQGTTLTGHSLGGGLAGLVEAMYHQDAVLFDHMPFETSANDNGIFSHIAA